MWRVATASTDNKCSYEANGQSKFQSRTRRPTRTYVHVAFFRVGSVAGRRSAAERVEWAGGNRHKSDEIRENDGNGTDKDFEQFYCGASRRRLQDVATRKIRVLALWGRTVRPLVHSGVNSSSDVSRVCGPVR